MSVSFLLGLNTLAESNKMLIVHLNTQTKQTMYKLISAFSLFFFFHSSVVSAQVFNMDTLQYQGNSSSYINFVILGDGYTAKEQDKFEKDANNFKNYFFNQSPYIFYKNYFNVFIIKVPSPESGVKHPHTANDCPDSIPASNPNNYFGSTFDRSGIHRLVAFTNTAALGRILAKNFPGYDQVVVIANSNNYGGSGGAFPVATVNVASNEIAVHEIGHSFDNLADEYWPGAGYAAEDANRTQENNPALVKWKAWIGTNGIGIYNYGGKAPLSIWYRPHESCKMQYLGYPFCSVCTEAIIEKIHTLISPIATVYPSGSKILEADSLKRISVRLIRPSPNTLKTQWFINDQLIAGNVDSIVVNAALFTNDSNTVRFKVIDTSNMLRTDEHFTKHTYDKMWIVKKSSLALQAPKVRWDSVEACTGTLTALSVANPQSGTQYNWYGDSAGKNILGSGINFITPVITGNRFYFVEASVGSKISRRTKIMIKALPSPQPPSLVTVDDGEVFYGNPARLRVTGVDTLLNYRWYGSASGVKSMGEDTLMMTPSLTATATYYIAGVSKKTGCVSNSRTKVVIAVKPKQVLPSVNKSSRAIKQ